MPETLSYWKSFHEGEKNSCLIAFLQSQGVCVCVLIMFLLKCPYSLEVFIYA